MTETESRIVRWLESIDERLQQIEQRLDVMASVLCSHGEAIHRAEQERLRAVSDGRR